MSHNHFIQNKLKKPSRKTTGRAAVMIAAMLVTLLFCSVTAFAWFSANVANTGNTIETGDYKITVELAEYPNTPALTNPNEQILYTGKYTVRLTASGAVSTGYCKVQVGEDSYYTQPLAPGEQIEFILAVNEEFTICSFTPYWGKYSGTENIIDPEKGIVVGTPSAGNSLNNEPSKPESTVSEAPESKDEAVEETPSEPVESKVESTESQTSSTESTESQVSETSGTSVTSEDPDTESPDEGTETETETETETTTSVEE